LTFTGIFLRCDMNDGLSYFIVGRFKDE